MSRPSAQRRLWFRLFLLFCVFCLVSFALLGWYVTTDSFQQAVRRRVVRSLEKATGGRVELGELHTIPLRLRVDIRNLTIHGREAADEAAYLHIDRLQAELKIISLVSTTMGLHSLVLERPVVHLVVYPDGSTNQPSPAHSQSLKQTPVEQLFAVSISQAEVHGGELECEEHRIPVDFDARHVSLALTYSFLRQHYEVRLSVGSVPTRLQQRPPFVWRADAAMVLSRNHAEISALNLASGKSELHFTGRVQDFHHPEIAGYYHGMLELGELSKLMPELDFRKGSAQIQGQGSWKLRDFSLEGTLEGKDLAWASRGIAIENGRLAAVFSITPQRLRVSAIHANVLGGELHGDLDIANWRAKPQAASAAPRGRVAPETLERGSAHLQMTAFPITPAIDFLSSQRGPLDRLNLAGAGSGELNMLWTGSIKDAEATIKLNVAPPSQPAAGQLALRGQIDGIYRGSRDELQLTQLHLATPASDLTASGGLGANSSLKLAFSSHDLNEWRPLLEAAFHSEELPLTVDGFVNFNGTVGGKPSALALNGNLEVYDFNTVLAPNKLLPARAVHWDALNAAIQYSTNNFAAHNGALIHGRTLAHFDLSTALSHGALEENPPFTLHLDLANLDLAEVARLAGFTPPVSGTLSLSASFAGSLDNPRGDGRLQGHDALVHGVALSSLRSDVHLGNHQVQFKNVVATMYGTSLSGSATVSTAFDDFRLNLAGENLDLAQLPHFHSDRILIDGRADFAVQANGKGEKPAVEAHVHLRDLALNKERAGDFYLDATTEGRQVDVQAHSDFDKAQLKLRGAIGLDRPFPADLNVDFDHLDVDSILNAYLRGKVTGHAPMAGTLHLHGPLRSPKELKVAGDIQTLSADIEHVNLQNVEPVRFEVADQVLHLETFHLTGSGTDFTAHGTAQLAPPREMDFHVDGTVNMSLLETLNQKLRARGTLAVRMDANGTAADPVLEGRIDVKDTFVSHDDFPSSLSDLNGVLLFDRNRIQIETLQGTTGGGTVNLTGSATYQKGAMLMDLEADAHDVRLRYPPGVSSTANANLRLAGTNNSGLLSGNVVVHKLSLTPGFDFASYLEKSKQSVVVTQHDNLASRLKLDVHVTSTPELQMQTAVAKLSGNADLRLRGTADRPVIMGRSVSEGDVSFNGTKYHVDRADITFSNPARTEPIVDIQASTRVRDYDITVTVNGNPGKPNGMKASWRSEPPLPEADVIELLALGRTREEAAAGQSGGSLGFGGGASNLLINQALNSAVSSRVQRLFGVSRIKIDPQGLASETSVIRGPQVTIEQQVASNLTVTYSTNLSVTSQQIIQLEYSVTGNLSLVALRDQNGVVSFDIKIRHRKR